MASAAAGYPWDRSSAPHHSPDTASMYADRPIRPLPKRRLRSRLSSEAAQTIRYPPVPPSSSPAYGSPTSQSERDFAEPKYLQEAHSGRIVEHEHVCECGEPHSGDESEDDEEEPELPPHRSSWPGRMTKYHRERAPNQPYQPPPPNSSTSSADGYESFENTNNKKKRKIPIPNGTPGPMPPGFEISAHSAAAVYAESTRGNASQGQNSASGTGLSGPGRGRFGRSGGRVSTERRPLANTYANGNYTDRGIISTAMANAKDAASAPSLNGQENVRHTPAKTSPQGFTFECKSATSDQMALARPPPPPPPPPIIPQPSAAPAATRGKAAAPPPPPPAKPRPSKKEVLDKQARHRKKKLEIENFHSPPSFGKPEDQWVCYMCEYEGWFGAPPKLFARKYEEKDFQRRKAKRIALKKLEQAKAKSRKGKKNKNGTKNTNNMTNSHAHSQPYDPANEYPPNDDGSQGEEFYDDDFDDSIPAPAPLDPRDTYANAQASSSFSTHRTGDGFHALDRSRSLPS